MPRMITLAPHVSIADIERRYRETKEPVGRTHWHLLWLIAQGYPLKQAAALVGYTPNWAGTLVRRYNVEGPTAMGDRRAEHRGGKPALLSAEDRAALQEALGSPPADGGLWTGPKVAAWIGERVGRSIHAQRGWEALRAVGFTPQRPRPTAIQADPVAQEAFKKGGSPPTSPSFPPRIPTPS